MIIQEQIQSKSGEQQITDTILMVRPHQFKSNQMTIVNNYFQTESNIQDIANINKAAQQQFDLMANSLRQAGVSVIVVQDPGQNNTPDSVFPNNWVSFHKNQGFILYPMFAQNRRLERKINIFQEIEKNGITLKPQKDYSKWENEKVFLQGTGSIILDRQYRIAFAALSPRTNKELFLQFCSQNNYEPCYFTAYQNVNYVRRSIYHTNVMMWIGEGVCGVCLSSIDQQHEREAVRSMLLKTNREILYLYQHQMEQFAGNTLMLKRKNQKTAAGAESNINLIVMSERAYKSLYLQQKQLLSKYGDIVYFSLETIQKYGGGSARCMMAEIF